MNDAVAGICQALGIDQLHVARLAIVCVPGEFARIVVTRLIPNQGEGGLSRLLEAVHEFELVERK